MSVSVLKSRRESSQARDEMRRRGIDCLSPPGTRLLRKIGLRGGVDVGHPDKSWDVLRTVEFLERTLSRDAPVLDIGAYTSEVLCSLHRLGYTALTGIDLNPAVRLMPHADSIDYVVGDFTRTPFADASFAAVTAISVIEHGFDGPLLLTELSRILRPGGYFVASVDYWPEKISTDGISAYGMAWKIFSERELRAFLEEANAFGLAPAGEPDFTAADRTMRWKGKRYTFAWVALKKTP